MQTRMEEVASQVMGKAKAVKATAKGLPGVFRTLMEEHGKVSALLMRVKASSDPEVRRRLFPDIRRELLTHEKGEISVVYPVFRQYAETVQIALEHDREAGQLESALAELHGMDVEDAAWGPAFERLVELVQHHVKLEESSYFPAADRIFGEQAEELDRRYKQTRASEMNRIG